MKFNSKLLAATIAIMILVTAAFGSTAFAANTDTAAPAAVDTQASKVEGAQTAVDAETETEDPNAVDNDNIEEENVDDENGAAEESGTDDADDQAALAAQASITEAEALSAAEKANPGVSFTGEGLQDENGNVVYGFTGTDNTGASIEVKVSAIDGSIMPEADGDYEG